MLTSRLGKCEYANANPIILLFLSDCNLHPVSTAQHLAAVPLKVSPNTWRRQCAGKDTTQNWCSHWSCQISMNASQKLWQIQFCPFHQSPVRLGLKGSTNFTEALSTTNKLANMVPCQVRGGPIQISFIYYIYIYIFIFFSYHASRKFSTSVGLQRVIHCIADGGSWASNCDFTAVVTIEPFKGCLAENVQSSDFIMFHRVHPCQQWTWNDSRAN